MMQKESIVTVIANSDTSEQTAFLHDLGLKEPSTEIQWTEAIEKAGYSNFTIKEFNHD
jgi:hypothetical protein